METLFQTIKVCSTCKKEKPLSSIYFHRSNISKDGYRHECKQCRNEKAGMVKGKLIKCVVCNTFLSKDFYDYNGNNEYRLFTDRRCKKCKYESSKNRKLRSRGSQDLRRLLVERFSGLKDRAKRKKIGVEFDVEYLNELWIKQNGLCAITNLPMTYIFGNGRTLTNVSVDKINPDGSYTKDNVQLVLMVINQIKSNLTNKQLIFYCEHILKNLKQ